MCDHGTHNGRASQHKGEKKKVEGTKSKSTCNIMTKRPCHWYKQRTWRIHCKFKYKRSMWSIWDYNFQMEEDYNWCKSEQTFTFALKQHNVQRQVESCVWGFLAQLFGYMIGIGHNTKYLNLTCQEKKMLNPSHHCKKCMYELIESFMGNRPMLWPPHIHNVSKTWHLCACVSKTNYKTRRRD